MGSLKLKIKSEKFEMKKQFETDYADIISLENLFAAWQEFICGKRKKKDVQEFGLHLTDNILQLHEELASFIYVHGGYKAFNISDPKPRNIHKASVRDRLLHHAIYRQMYPFFDRTFIADSFSCRVNKGVHRALNRFRIFGLRVSRNNTRTAWVLKMDIKKFFANINHEILLGMLKEYIPEKDIIWLLQGVIGSFSSLPPLNLPLIMGEKGEWGFPPLDGEPARLERSGGGKGGVGLPLGNLTSQLFCNIYMNELDQFVKHKVKAEYYIRYADDFILLCDDRERLLDQVNKISEFLEKRLRLSLHPDKVYIKTLASGVDFLGWVHFPNYRILRTTTQRRALKRIQERPTNETAQSYLGLASHGKAFKFKQRILNWHGLLREDNQ